MKAIILLFFLGGSLILHAQQAKLHANDSCSTGRNASYLNAAEKEVLAYLNMARAYPHEFLNRYLPNAGEQLHATKTEAYRSLVKELSSRKAIAMLQPDEKLAQFAKAHASDMGKTGKTGHISSKGKTFKQRTEGFSSGMGENCDYSYDDPLLIVAHLLIDEKVPGYGHRKNILNPDYKLAGISIQPHTKYKVNCVMDLSR